jgi:hypothetical protein
MVSATVPDIPLISNHFLFTPKKGYPLYLMMYELMTNETRDLASTSSWAGMCCILWDMNSLDPFCPKSLTKKFTTKKQIPDRMINKIPFFTP